MGNLNGGMSIHLSGWYGGTIDPISSVPTKLLCDSCAREFLASWWPDYGE